MTDLELSYRLDSLIQSGEATQRMIEATREMIEHPYGMLTLWGGWGNGKSVALCIVVNELRERRNMEGAYVRFKDLIEYVKAGFSNKDGAGEERERYNFLKTVPVLAIDEIEKPRMTTEYGPEFRSSFLDDRYRLALSGDAVTVLAMNCDPEELPGDVYSRLRDGRFSIIHNSDRDVRQTMTR